MFHNLTKNTLTKRIKPDGATFEIAAGTGDTLNSDSVDVFGFGGICFTLLLGAITATAVTTVKAQHCDDNATWVDVPGTTVNVAVADATKLARVEIARPRKRYARLVTTRATANAVVDGLIVTLFNPSNAPVTQDATIAQAPAIVVSP